MAAWRIIRVEQPERADDEQAAARTARAVAGDALAGEAQQLHGFRAGHPLGAAQRQRAGAPLRVAILAAKEAVAARHVGGPHSAGCSGREGAAAATAAVDAAPPAQRHAGRGAIQNGDRASRRRGRWPNGQERKYRPSGGQPPAPARPHRRQRRTAATARAPHRRLTGGGGRGGPVAPQQVVLWVRHAHAVLAGRCVGRALSPRGWGGAAPVGHTPLSGARCDVHAWGDAPLYCPNGAWIETAAHSRPLAGGPPRTGRGVGVDRRRGA